MDIKPIVVNGLVAGISAWIMATFVSWLHERYTKDIPEERKELTYDVEQYRELIVEAEFEKAFTTCLEALKKIKKSKVKSIDRINRVLTASAGMTFRSFGEKIKISIKEVSQEIMEISIESKPKVWWASADYGKSYENVEALSEYVRATLPTGGH